jgi:hypothetical protein
VSSSNFFFMVSTVCFFLLSSRCDYTKLFLPLSSKSYDPASPPLPVSLAPCEKARFDPAPWPLGASIRPPGATTWPPGSRPSWPPGARPSRRAGHPTHGHRGVDPAARWWWSGQTRVDLRIARPDKMGGPESGESASLCKYTYLGASP